MCQWEAGHRERDVHSDTEGGGVHGAETQRDVHGAET